MLYYSFIESVVDLGDTMCSTCCLTMPRQNNQDPVGNPKFIEWLEEWLTDAERIQNKNLVFVYKKVTL
jgi:hypothetical protein